MSDYIEGYLYEVLPIRARRKKWPLAISNAEIVPEYLIHVSCSAGCYGRED